MATPPISNPGEDELQKPALVLPVKPPREPAWGIVDVLVLGAGTFLVILILASVFLVPFMIAQRLPPGTALPVTLVAKAAIPAEFIAYILLIAVAKIVLGMRGHPGLLKAVQWNWPSGQRIFSLMGFAVACAIVVVKSGSLFNIPPDLPIEEMLKDRVVANMFLLFGILPAPFVEELYFRGLLYPALQRKLGTVVGVILTAAAFAGLHASQLASALAPLVMLFAVGMVLTLIRALTGSVAAAFVFHVAYNAALFLIDSFVK